MSAELLRKITISTCGLNKDEIKKAVTGKKTTVDLLKVVGITTKAQSGQTDKGEFLKLSGTFKAVNLLTGEVFDSSSCILPNFVSEPLAVALDASNEVEFAILIGAKEDVTSVVGYQFTVKPLVESKPTDKLEALMNAAKFDNVKKLAAA